jgi:hypothetical protein
MRINKRSNGENQKEFGLGIAEKHSAENTLVLAFIIAHNMHATARDALLVTVTRLRPAVGRRRGIAVVLLAHWV